jgi:hypothetical protein
MQNSDESEVEALVVGAQDAVDEGEVEEATYAMLPPGLPGG